MTLSEIRYVEDQLFQVAPVPLTEENYPFGFDIQIRTECNKTNFLRITPDQMKKIETILLGA